jgi:hypothetical protein
MDLQLLEDDLHAGSRRLGRDRQQGSDLLCGEPAGEELEHQLLLFRQ